MGILYRESAMALVIRKWLFLQIGGSFKRGLGLLERAWG